MKLSEKINIPTACDPSFYTTYDNLNNVNIGDIISVTFKDKEKVKIKFQGKTVKFLVNNYMEHNWRRNTRRLALIPLENIDLDTDLDSLTLKPSMKKDIIILDDSDRFECLMIDLFDINKVPFKGWKKKIVTFTITDNIINLEREHKLNKLTK